MILKQTLAEMIEFMNLQIFISNIKVDSGSAQRSSIGHFGKYHNTLCLSPQILHTLCFQFLLGLTMVPRENKNNASVKFGGTNKEYYGIFPKWPM